MKKLTTLSATAALMLVSFADAQAAANPSADNSTRKLVSVSNFGDFMGQAKDDQLTAQRRYLYNKDLQLTAVIEVAAGLDNNELTTQYYNPYIYDEQGRLVKMDRYQYGLYEYGERVMHQAAGVVEFVYDEAGNCVQRIEDQTVISYEYDAEGNCIKEVTTTSGKEGKTLLYSDFSAGRNKPALVVSSHTQPSYTGEFYEETREYDAEGNLVLAQRLCNRDYVEDYGLWAITTAAGDFMQEEHWTYENGHVSLYEKFNSIDEETGELQPYLKTVYTEKDANTIGQQSYTAFGNEWYKSGVYQEEAYFDFAGMTDNTAVELVKADKSAYETNGVILMFTSAAIADTDESTAYNVYRNGDLIYAATSGDGLVGMMGADMEIEDHDVPSGQYEYIIQTVTSTGSYCVSNRLGIDMTMELPAATNLRAIESVKDKNDYNYVTVAFDVPQAPAEYGFISNELLIGNNQIGEESSKDPSVNRLHCTLADDTGTVSILTRYKFGRAVSERVTIDVNNLSSIEEVRALGDEQMQIFDLNGHQVVAPLESLHGQYIILSGKTAYKVILK